MKHTLIRTQRNLDKQTSGDLDAGHKRTVIKTASAASSEYCCKKNVFLERWSLLHSMDEDGKSFCCV